MGFALGCVWFVREGARRGVARVALIDVCIAAVVGGVVGGRILHVLVEPLPGHALSAAEVDALRARAAAEDLDPALRAALEDALARPPVHAPWEFVALMPPGDARERAIELARRDPSAVPARLWYRARPAQALAFWNGGLAYLGGVVLATALCLLVAWRHRAPLLELTDLAFAATVLGLIFGRLGCFLGGCCYGEVCAPAWWASAPPWYPPGLAALPRYPTALLAALNAALLFAFLRWFLPRRAFAGEGALAMLALYAPGRFLIEALRADPRGGAWGLSTSQVAVLVTGVPAALAWAGLRLRLRGRDSDVTPAPTTLDSEEPTGQA